MAKIQEKHTNPKQPKFPSERDTALHLRWILFGWSTHSSTSTSFRMSYGPTIVHNVHSLFLMEIA